MKYKFEVEVWTFISVEEEEDESPINNYQWNREYAGDDKEKAFAEFEACKANGCECVRLTWR